MKPYLAVAIVFKKLIRDYFIAPSFWPQLIATARFLSQLEQQLTDAKRINHSGILRCLGLQEAEGHHILLYEDAEEYQPLSYALARGKEFDTSHAIDIIRQIASILDYALQRKLLHGWIRPDAVLISNDGKIIIDEFGIPKPHDYLIRESIGRTADTNHYFAPELLDAQPHDETSEIFTIGALFFRLVSGAGLLSGYNAHEALHRIRSNGPKRLAEVNPKATLELTEFCQRICAVGREDRPRSFQQLQGELDRFGRGRSIEMTQSIVRRRSRDLSGNQQALKDPSGKQASLPDEGLSSVRRRSVATDTGYEGSLSGARRLSDQNLTSRHQRQDVTQQYHKSQVKKSSQARKSKRGGLSLLLLLLLGGGGAAGYFLWYVPWQQQQQQSPENQPTTPGSGQSDLAPKPPSLQEAPPTGTPTQRGRPHYK